jgi:hypothetical protein
MRVQRLLRLFIVGFLIFNDKFIFLAVDDVNLKLIIIFDLNKILVVWKKVLLTNKNKLK